jgi:ParB family chromosome partitioning protein
MCIESIREIDVCRLDPNPYQARAEYPESELKDLGNSIKEKGLLEPIIVRSKGDRYEIAVGERRARACKLMGIEKISAIVKELSDEEMAEYVLIENLQRKDLNAIEEARGFKTLQERFGWTQEKIAKRAGRGLTRDIVAQRLRLLTFPSELQELVSHDTVTPTHAEILAKLAGDPTLLKETMSKVVDQKLTTKQTEQLIGEAIETRDLRKSILDYVTSEHFILEQQFIHLALSELTGDEACPSATCGSILELTDRLDERGYYNDVLTCKKCGWIYGVTWGPRQHLVEKIDMLRALKEAKAKGQPSLPEKQS